MKQQPIQMDNGAVGMVEDLKTWWGLPPKRSATTILLRCLTIVHSREKAKRELAEFDRLQDSEPDPLA